MAGTVLRNAGKVLSIILKLLFWIALTALKALCAGIALFLLLLSLVVRLVFTLTGISSAV